MEPSKFQFFSFGTVAANKPRTDENGKPELKVEVFPQEKFTMSAGELTDNVDTIEVKGKDGDGQDYEGKIETKPSITCLWLPIGEPNRVTPPDVRRNELVIIYRYGDTNFYFWSTAFNNVIRKLETVAWWWSGTPVDGEGADTERTADNGYLLEVSTHDKHIILSTSKKNGEKCRYFLQFDMANGHFNLSDDLGNEIDLDSVAGVLTATTENEIIHNTKKYTVNCLTYTVNAKEGVKFNTPKVHMSKDLQVDGASLLKGFANFTTGIGGGGYGETTATLTFKGSVTQMGNWKTIGNLDVEGTGKFSGNVDAPNIN